MNRRVRLNPTQTRPVNKYLKPGALARLRDSRISSSSRRSHRLNYLPRSDPTLNTQPDNVLININNNVVAQFEFFPDFSTVDCGGTRCFGRKKLCAVKTGFSRVLIVSETINNASNDSVVNRLLDSGCLKNISDLHLPIEEIMKWGGNRRLRSYMSEEFGEEDVWDVMNNNGVVRNVESKGGSLTSVLSVSRRLPSAARMIQASIRHEKPHRLDCSNDDDDESKVMPHSAPVNIPDWSKIYGNGTTPIRKKKKDNGACVSISNYDDDDGDAEEKSENEDDGDDRLPPHEWLAKKLARSQISTFSVCEGAGRTLKGRDLSKVRNAVLSKTGFI